MIGGEQLGSYCLSEPQSGSDAAALSTRAVRDGEDYVVNGTKAWITHAGQSDFYTLMVRTSDDGARGISTLLAEAATPGLSAAKPENKMGMRSSTTAQVLLEDARVPAERLIGAEGQGFSIALSALEAGRLGIAACAVGVAQAALDAAVEYAKTRRQFGKPIAEFQGLGFMLADMATAVEVGRSAYLAAARRRDAGQAYGTQAAMAKLFCTDMAMKVTTDAVPGPRRLRLHRRLPRRALYARGQGAADRRGHQPGAAAGHQQGPDARLTVPGHGPRPPRAGRTGAYRRTGADGLISAGSDHVPCCP